MTGRRPTRRSLVGAVLAIVLLLTGLVAGTTTASASSAGARPAQRPSAARRAAPAACAVPTDCRLGEAGRVAGIKVGLATSTGTDQHRAVIAREASAVVNHQLSWSGIEPERGVWDFSKADTEYQFALDHHLFQIGMHFAWDQAVVDDLPEWVTQITDPVELRSVLAERAHVIFTRYPKLDRIDVINEPFDTLGSNLVHNHFYAVLGPDYIAQLFAIVEAAAPPTTQLIVNEGGIEYQPAKAAALVGLVRTLRAQGHRVDAVGVQSHLSAGEPDWNLLLTTMQQLAALGTHPFISELDVPVPPIVPDRAQVQAQRYRNATEVCLMVPACDVLDIWGVSDAKNWYDGSLYPGLDPLLFDAAYQPKPAYAAVRDALLGGRIAPHRFPLPVTTRLSGGQAQAVLHEECRATSALVPHGPEQLSTVVAIYAGGNPVRLDVPLRWRWDATASADGSAHHHAELALDLATLAARTNEETARPAVGLGGHHELVDTVWLRLTATHLVVTGVAPAGGSSTGGTELAGPLVGDSRTAQGPQHLAVDWTTQVTPGTTARQVEVAPPSLAFTLTIDLGVVLGTTPVGGGTQATMTCEAVGDVPVAVATVPAAAPTAAVPTSPAATAVTGLPAYAG